MSIRQIKSIRGQWLKMLNKHSEFVLYMRVGGGKATIHVNVVSHFQFMLMFLLYFFGNKSFIQVGTKTINLFIFQYLFKNIFIGVLFCPLNLNVNWLNRQAGKTFSALRNTRTRRRRKEDLSLKPLRSF